MSELLPILDSRYRGLKRSPGCEGIQIFGGRMETPVTAGGAGTSTYEIAMELMARSALSVGDLTPIFSQSRAASSPGGLAVVPSAGFVGALADLDSSVSALNTAFFDVDKQAAATQLPLPISNRNRAISFQYFPISSIPVARTDGGNDRPLAVCRTYVGSVNTAMLGNSGGTDSFTNWASRSSGSVRLRSNSGSGDQRNTLAGWSAVNTGPCIGFAFGHRGPIINVMSVGDSITEGRGTYIGRGFGYAACEALNAQNPKTWFAHSNLGWSGVATAVIVDLLQDAINQGVIPDILIFPIGSPNDPGNGNINTGHVSVWRRGVAAILALCARYGITPIAWTILPTNSAVNNYGATDALRVAYNAEQVAALTAAGVTVVDLATAFSGVTTGGQVQMVAGSTSDNIHPNDTGIDTIGMPLIRDAIISITGGYL